MFSWGSVFHLLSNKSKMFFMKSYYFSVTKSVLIVIVLFLFSCSQDDQSFTTEQKEIVTVQNEQDAIIESWTKQYNIEELKAFANTERTVSDEAFMRMHNSIAAKKVVKTNPTKVYAHYMPWFESAEIHGAWGQHWTMTNRNPDIFDENGKREIATHYYPKIGPYDTTDRDLQQYHLSLMRLCGIDGVIFDWYGSRSVLDFESIKINVESFIDELERTKLEFAITYEDRVINETARVLTDEQIETAQNDLLYAEANYFTSENYIQFDNTNLLMIFGPNFVDRPEDWDIIFSVLSEQPKVLSLWGAHDVIGSGSSGEFAWVDQDHLTALNGYYETIDFESLDVAGAIYPGFDDYYVEGGWKTDTSNDWVLEHNGVQTFMESMNATSQYPVDFVQLITWNDFGEGTMIEPTEEFGYTYLEEVQNFTGVTFDHEDLRIPYYIYTLRKQLPNQPFAQFLLKRAHRYLMKSKINKARMLVCIVNYLYN